MIHYGQISMDFIKAVHMKLFSYHDLCLKWPPCRTAWIATAVTASIVVTDLQRTATCNVQETARKFVAGSSPIPSIMCHMVSLSTEKTSGHDVNFLLTHDDVIKWKYFRVTGLWVGNSPVTGECPTQRPVTGSFYVFICAWTNSWANNGDTGYLRLHRAHYDTTVMLASSKICPEQPALPPETTKLGAWQLRVLNEENGQLSIVSMHNSMREIDQSQKHWANSGPLLSSKT